MSNAPNEIIIEVPVGSVLGRNGRGEVKFQTVKYRRSDLPPTPAEAMRCPEVMALVEAMRSASSSLEAIALHSPSKGSSVVAEAAWRRSVAAIAALEQAVLHD